MVKTRTITAVTTLITTVGTNRTVVTITIDVMHRTMVITTTVTMPMATTKWIDL